MADAPYIYVGKILGAHGIKGQLKLWSECRPKEGILAYQRFYLADRQPVHELKVLCAKQQGKHLLAVFQGFEDRNQAETLQGQSLFIHINQLERKKGEYYWVDMIGLSVHNRENHMLGKIADLYETGANDVLVVRGKYGEILIPFIRPDYVERIEPSQGKLHVDWPLSWLQDDEN